MAGPEHAHGWLGTLMPVLEKGGPVTTLVLGLCAAAMILGLYREVNRLHLINREVVERLLAERQTQVEWLKTLQPTGSARGVPCP